uniref:Aspartic proteinase nepenthesin-1 n=1 Tax=Cajanus cajan TaxID=3821 RepID=A0A151TPR6_CAJCA|nr:Aspartic proteinase nepenthesin-1 [Cajanus cajan]
MSHSSTLIVVLCLYNLSFSKAFNDGFSLEIIHRDSTRSPFYRPTETQFQRVANAVRRSVKRTNMPYAIITPDLGEYLVSYSVGTPPFKIFGIVDTGSDIIWLQCQPCKACYKQTAPLEVLHVDLDGEGNIIIDSGTTLTFLPPDVYSKFESAVAQVVKLKRVQDPTQLFSLCYKATLDNLNAPMITAHFRGADVGLNSINTFTQVAMLGFPINSIRCCLWELGSAKLLDWL